MEPSPDYEPVMKQVTQKIALSKIVIEFLMDEAWQCPGYEDLLQRLSSCTEQNLNEEILLRHAQFICDQVVSFDAAADGDERPLITTPCMRALVKIAGVTFQKRQKMKKFDNKVTMMHIHKPFHNKVTTYTVKPVVIAEVSIYPAKFMSTFVYS